MHNVSHKVERDKLIITVDLSADAINTVSGAESLVLYRRLVQDHLAQENQSIDLTASELQTVVDGWTKGQPCDVTAALICINRQGAQGSAPASWAPEVFVDGKWWRNELRFATEQEAEANAYNHMGHWTLVEDHRATRATEPVNYRWTKHELVRVDGDNA